MGPLPSRQRPFPSPKKIKAYAAPAMAAPGCHHPAVRDRRGGVEHADGQHQPAFRTEAEVPGLLGSVLHLIEDDEKAYAAVRSSGSRRAATW
jgi:hypothetical protein